MTLCCYIPALVKFPFQVLYLLLTRLQLLNLRPMVTGTSLNINVHVQYMLLQRTTKSVSNSTISCKLDKPVLQVQFQLSILVLQSSHLRLQPLQIT